MWFLPMMAFAQIDDPVSAILSEDAHPGFQKRHHLLHGLNDHELQTRASELLAFLQWDEPPPRMSLDNFHSLKNDVANLLISKEILSVRHLQLSLDTIRNPEANEVWRDYCLQKLPAQLNIAGLPASERERGKRLLDELTRGDIPRLTGTALLSAHRMLEESNAELVPPKDELARRALRCARSPGDPLIDRVTALQVAARLRAPGAFEFAVSHLETLADSAPDMLHVSALASLGYSENPAYLDLLSRHRLSPDIRLRAAARGAIQHLQP